MLNQYMNKAMNIISAMSFEEKMLYMSICFEESIMDKDAIMGIEKPDKDLPSEDEAIYYNEDGMYLESWAMFANADQEYNRLLADLKKKAKMGNKHSKKNIRKDKSKAGYHNGARNQGFVPYERFGLKERLNKDKARDEDSQIREFYNPVEEITVDEAVKRLWKIYSHHFKYFDTVLVPIMPYSYYDDDDLYKNIEFVKEKYEECKGVLEDIQPVLYELTGQMAGSQGISWEKEVVNAFNDKVLDCLETRKDCLIQYLAGVYKNHIDHQIFKEGMRHVDEMNRLNYLKKKVEKYLK